MPATESNASQPLESLTKDTMNSDIGVKFSSLVGNTPLVDLSSLLSSNAQAMGTRLLAKAEFFNPGFSLKDRIASHILDTAERKGDLRKGDTVLCASSGNTGAATAMLCAMRGYRCIVLTSPKCSSEKVNSIKAYGAKVVIVKKDYDSAAAALAAEHGYFDMDQYDNPLNREAYFLSMGPEIWTQTKGRVTHFVSGGSTGGHISGVSRYLKQMNPDVHVTLVDPCGSVLLDQYDAYGHEHPSVRAAKKGAANGNGVAGGHNYNNNRINNDNVNNNNKVINNNHNNGLVELHAGEKEGDTVDAGETDNVCDGTEQRKTRRPIERTKSVLEGVGKGRVPDNIQFQLIDNAIRVDDVDAITACRRMAMEEGVLAGGSSGLHVAAGIKIANSLTSPGVVACILCDLGSKYASKIYNDDFLLENDVVMPVSTDVRTEFAVPFTV